MKIGAALRERLAASIIAAGSPDRYAHFALAVPEGERRRLATGWFALGLVALVGAGLLSILLVLSRTPYLQNLFPLADFFHVALVVHVDLSVLGWFVAFARDGREVPEEAIARMRNAALSELITERIAF
jgi:hypothetical protein